MYEYRRRNKLGAGSILLILIFILVIAALAVLYFVNKGKFWDILPIASIVIIVLSLIFAIFNMARKADGGFIFIILFLIFLAGLVLSNLFGPFALNKNAQEASDKGDYKSAIKNYEEIIKNYSTSRYYNEALKNVVSDYNNAGDFENTIKYLNLCIEKKIIDTESLEVKKIFSNSYSKLAEKAYGRQDYNAAALNYIMTINILKDILANFPDSDEAFISNYKIPEYLYKAADSYKKAGNFSQGIEILKQLLKDYPESTQVKEGGDLIFGSYMEEVLNLIDNSKYSEALDEYLSAAELALKNNPEIQIDMYNSQVFSKIPEETLLEYAAGICKEGNYAGALQIFTYMFSAYPELSENINPYYATCKVKILSKSSYEVLPEIKLVSNIKNQGNFVLTVYNRTEKELILYFNSTAGSLFKLKAGSRLDITLSAGNFEIAGEFAETISPVYYGNFNFEENKRYSQVFIMETAATESTKKAATSTTKSDTSTTTTTTSGETSTTQ
ncbi:MAG: tetratricopeptide repeat protein [Actinobacteria bacterium]|nr:tetratricopeptide repeat protein [Actinomycetota bacterium]MCL6088191.1 tetratricopeptide repeat protein [Actinomycetota bacterium]